MSGPVADPHTLQQRIRRGLNAPMVASPNVLDANAALSELVSLLEHTQQERDDRDQEQGEALDLINALKARAEALEKEREELECDVKLLIEKGSAMFRRAEAAEALAETYREALEATAQFLLVARPMLGMSIANSLGKQADDLYADIRAALAAGEKP